MISASMVKELREISGAGMLDCKKALESTNGNIEEAINYLREKGMAKAEKKLGRIAAEGLAVSKVDGNRAVVLEVNSETDFVAKNEEFISLTNVLADVLLENEVSTVEEALKISVDGKTVEDLITEKIAVIGEKLSLRRFEILTKEDNQVFGTYSHMGGKIVAVVILDGSDEELARDVAMQVAAMRPEYLERSEVPAERVEKEKVILREQLENEGTDANKIEMILNGRLNKLFYAEICLVDQTFIKEKMSVAKYVESKNSKIIKFVRVEVGEGMDKKCENFADEVMKQINN